MSTDIRLVRTVQELLAPRVPSTIIEIINAFANWENVEQKEAMLKEFRRFSICIANADLHESRAIHKFAFETRCKAIDGWILLCNQIQKSTSQKK